MDATTEQSERLRLAQAGDRPARAELVRELQDVWFRMSLSLLGDQESAREATQETALRFLRDLSKFRGGSLLRTWAIGIAVNVAREMKRKSHRVTVAAGEEAVDAADGPILRLAREEDQSILRKLLDGLPERQREAVVMRFFEDLSVEQTAQAMNCAPGTIKATVHQALRALREKFSLRQQAGNRI